MEVDMTVQDTVTTTIQAPPEAVWRWVADITRHADWSPKPYRVELVSGDLNAVGSRYRSVGWVPPNDGPIAPVVAWAPGGLGAAPRRRRRRSGR